MQYKVILRKCALKFLQSIPKEDKERIELRLQELSKNPRNEHVIKLTNKLDQYRAKQGNYRIIFYIFDDSLVVDVIDIDRRKDIYK